MEDLKTKYNKPDDLIITFADTDPVPLSDVPYKFKSLTVQADGDNAEVMFVGGENPSTQLINNASQPFENGDLSKIYVKGAVGDKAICLIEA